MLPTAEPAYTLAAERINVGDYPNGMPAACVAPLASASACAAAATVLGLTYGGETPTCVNATVKLYREDATDLNYTGSFEIWTFDAEADSKDEKVYSAALAANNDYAVSDTSAVTFTVCLAPGTYAACGYVGGGGNADSAAFNWEVGSDNGELDGDLGANAGGQTA